MPGLGMGRLEDSFPLAPSLLMLVYRDMLSTVDMLITCKGIG